MHSHLDAAALKLDTNALTGTLRELNGLADAFGRAMSAAFRKSAFEGRRLKDVLRGIALDLSSRALRAAFAPIERGIGNLFSGLMGGLFGGPGAAGGLVAESGLVKPFARGGIVNAPALLALSGSGGAGGAGRGLARPFARGGIVNAPTLFALTGAGGAGPRLGLMGEAGPEAVLPLRRGTDGRLGVGAAGGQRGVTVHFHVTSPDAASFRRAEADIAAMLARAVARGQRGL